jgi:hypothetical protein
VFGLQWRSGYEDVICSVSSKGAALNSLPNFYELLNALA